MRRGLVGLASVLLVVLAPARAETAITIQPGDAMSSETSECTLGYVVDGGTQTRTPPRHRGPARERVQDRTYFLTAAHCVERVGEQVHLGDGRLLGHVVVRGGNGDAIASDWALVQVRPELVGEVGGAVRGIAGAPSGVATPEDTAEYDDVRFSGWGLPWFVAPSLRENRPGWLAYQDNERWSAVGTDSFGDSGGPIVHGPSRKALGLVSHTCGALVLCETGDLGTSQGPTVEGILDKATVFGYELTLRTA